MKILYGIQGTGHGHISRAREIIPCLSKHASVDVLISGYNCKMHLEHTDVLHKRGISLTYDNSGSVSYLKTALNIKPVTFLRDINSVNPEMYDLVISDYEPVTAWASIHSKTPSVGLSHQASFLSDKCPRPKTKSLFSESVLKYFAPVNRSIGFHFKRYDSFILPPVIRREIRDLSPTQKNHVTVYLPSFDHESLAAIFIQFRHTDWHLFSPNCEEEYFIENVWVRPVGNKPFLESIESSKGVIAGAGFETCAEAMYLGKKLLAIPIKNQYEQYCNAAALSEMGVVTVNQIEPSFSNIVQNWIDVAPIVQLEEAAEIDELAELLFRFTSLRKGRCEKVSIL
jgi:uncharacterized protein (TIGR00661 family)